MAYDRSYSSQYDIIHADDPADDMGGLVPMECFVNGSILYWNGWMPLLYKGKKESHRSPTTQGSSLQKPDELSSDSSSQATITFLRGTFDIDKIICKSIDRSNFVKWQNLKERNERNRRCFIMRFPDDASDNSIRPVTAIDSYGMSLFDSADEKLVRLLKDRECYGNRSFGMGNKLDRLYFPPNVRDVIDTVKHWRNSSDWYTRHGVCWKMGLLLYGLPGVGKSALIRAIAFDLDMPVYIFGLSQMDDRTLIKSWKTIISSSPCIALFEDIDTIFKGRENIVQQPMMPYTQRREYTQNENSKGYVDNQWQATGRVTFDTFLNVLDGVNENHGILTVITTNRLDHIDEALGKPVVDGDSSLWLSTRPGRIDRAVELTYMRNEEKLEFARKILCDMPHALGEAIDRINNAEKCKPETPAQVQEWITRIALYHHWCNKK